MEDAVIATPPAESKLLKDRRWVEEIVHLLLKKDDVFYGHFTRQCAVYVFRKPRASGEIAYIGAHPKRGLVLGLNREVLEKLSPAQQREVVKHEILHCVYGHISRRNQNLRKKYGQNIYSIAVDLVVNQHINIDLLRENDALSGVKIDDFELPKDLTTGEYCRLLNDKRQTIEIEVELPGDGEDSSGGDGSGKGKAKNSKGKGKKGAGDGKKKVKIIFERIGNVGDDKVSSEEVLESGLADQLVRQAVAKAMQGGNGRGLFGGEAAEYIDALNKPPSVPWQLYLRRSEARAKSVKRVQTLYKTSRRNKDHLGFKRKRKLNVWYQIDTSGSMDSSVLALADSEAKGMVRRGAQVEVFHQDASIAKREKYKKGSSLRQFFGRGGTDFSPGLIASLNSKGSEKPGLIVVFTDGYGGIEQYVEECKKRHLPVPNCGERTADGVYILWLLTPGGMDISSFKKVAPFGAVAKMETYKKQ